MDDGNELIDVKVPRKHLAPVYGLIAELERAETPGEGAPVEPTSESVSNGAGGWAPELVAKAYIQSPPAMKRIFDMLADKAGSEIVSDELAKAIGPDAEWPNLAGTLGAFGRRVKSRYKQTTWPFAHRWDHDREKMVYSMPSDVAEIIRGA
jgi:hypothetical protein